MRCLSRLLLYLGSDLHLGILRHSHFLHLEVHILDFFIISISSFILRFKFLAFTVIMAILIIVLMLLIIVVIILFCSISFMFSAILVFFFIFLLIFIFSPPVWTSPWMCVVGCIFFLPLMLYFGIHQCFHCISPNRHFLECT
jgi:hypothetical protein